MAIEGNLRDMSLPTLVQSLIQDGGPGVIELQAGLQIGTLFIDSNTLVHAEIRHSTDPAKRQEGDNVVYELLSWQEGKFAVERNVTIPKRTIEKPWNFLLMEGLRQLDEQQKDAHTASSDPQNDETLAEMLLDLSPDDAAAIRSLFDEQEDTDTMATKSEELGRILQEIVSNSSDISGAVIVDNDGLLLASALGGSQDGNRIAAISAGLVSLAGRSASQLQQGNVKQTLIQAENGNVVALRAGERASLVALTRTGVNLGMIFLETQDAAKAIRDVL